MASTGSVTTKKEKAVVELVEAPAQHKKAVAERLVSLSNYVEAPAQHKKAVALINYAITP